MPVRFFDHNVTSKLKNKRRLASFLETLIQEKKKEIKRIDLSYIFCDDEYLNVINQEFLNHDTYTDIITFDLSESKDELTGEIYISVERIKENAEKFKVKYDHELHRVVFHGALHLCGFKDKTKEEKERMRREEDNCLKKYFEA